MSNLILSTLRRRLLVLLDAILDEDGSEILDEDGTAILDEGAP